MYFLCTVQKEKDNSCALIKGHIQDLPYIKGHLDIWLTSRSDLIEGFVSAIIDFWPDSHHEEQFGAFIVNVTAFQ